MSLKGFKTMISKELPASVETPSIFILSTTLVTIFSDCTLICFNAFVPSVKYPILNIKINAIVPSVRGKFPLK